MIDKGQQPDDLHVRFFRRGQPHFVRALPGRAHLYYVALQKVYVGLGT